MHLLYFIRLFFLPSALSILGKTFSRRKFEICFVFFLFFFFFFFCFLVFSFFLYFYFYYFFLFIYFFNFPRKNISKAVPLLQFFFLCASVVSYHYENRHSNILKILQPKKKNYQNKKSDIFHITAQNIDCWYSLEPPQ